MATRFVVADTGPLIVFARLERLILLRDVCGEVWLPKSVEREAVNDPRRPGAAAIIASINAGTLFRASPNIDDVDAPHFPTLGAGESAAIRLAMQMKCPLVMDEKRGRAIATIQRIPVIGTLGVLLSAKQSGYLVQIKPILTQMIQLNYFVSPSLYSAALKASGER